MDPFLGEIRMFAGNFAPNGWAMCDGALLPVNQNAALFSLLGTAFGGNGQTTFGLPDLRSRVAVHAGQGTGLSPYTLGEKGGSENVTLLANQMPPHTHPQAASNSTQSGQADPSGAVCGTDGSAAIYSATPNVVMSPLAIGAAGGGQPHANLQPFLCVNFIIATQGMYPSRP